jgi:hypothetical protein
VATPEEKEELIDAIKHPIRHYRIMLWGYGGESAYLSLTKDQFEYWKAKDDEEYDSTLTYMLDEDREEVTDVPPEMEFMSDLDDMESARYSWHDAPNEIVHQYGVTYDSANITIEEVDSGEYNANVVDTLVDGADLNEWANSIEESSEHSIVEMDCCTERESDYMLQFYSSEKGTFFEGYFTTQGKFDPKKLKIYTTEYFNGDDTVETVEYNGDDVENCGGDTNGKGYSVHLWKNV